MKRLPDEHAALKFAAGVGALSPCAKSKRGVVVWSRRYGLLTVGFNHPPDGFACDGSEACRAACNKVCVHAEVDALRGLAIEMSIRRRYHALLLPDTDHVDLHPEMLHLKVVDGVGVPSGPPSCWQCSREVLMSPIEAFWLLHEDGLRRYEPDEFHELTLRHCDLPVIRQE